MDRKSTRMNTYFYRKCLTRPTKIQSILIKFTFRQNFYGFISNFSGTILWQKSNQMLSNMLSQIRIHFLKMRIPSNLIKNSILHFAWFIIFSICKQKQFYSINNSVLHKKWSYGREILWKILHCLLWITQWTIVYNIVTLKRTGFFASSLYNFIKFKFKNT